MNERQGQILAILRERGHVSVAELARTLYVCEMTVRRDLRALEAEGKIRRYCGGAMLFEKENEFPFSDRKLLQSKEKTALAKRAAEYAEDASVIFVDSSSTCSYLIPQLSLKKDIKIVTNSLSTMALAMQYHIPCMMVGGDCYDKDLCNVGSFALEMLDRIHADLAFFSSNAISQDGLITDTNAEQTAVRRTVLKHAMRSIFLFTRSKQNKTATYTVCRAEDIFCVLCE